MDGRLPISHFATTVGARDAREAAPKGGFSANCSGSALPDPHQRRDELTTRQASLHAADRSVASPAKGFRRWASTAAFPPTPPACYRASWQLPGPDSHQQATTSLRCEINSTASPPSPGRAYQRSVTRSSSPRRPCTSALPSRSVIPTDRELPTAGRYRSPAPLAHAGYQPAPTLAEAGIIGRIANAIEPAFDDAAPRDIRRCYRLSARPTFGAPVAWSGRAHQGIRRSSSRGAALGGRQARIAVRACAGRTARPKPSTCLSRRSAASATATATSSTIATASSAAASHGITLPPAESEAATSPRRVEPEMVPEHHIVVDRTGGRRRPDLARQERSQRHRVWLPWPSLPNPLRKPKALTGLTSNT